MEYSKKFNAFFGFIKGEGSFKLDKDDYQAMGDIFSTLGKIAKKPEIKESAPMLWSILGGVSKIFLTFFIIGVVSLVVIFYKDAPLSALDYGVIIYTTLACAVLAIVFAIVRFILMITLPK